MTGNKGREKEGKREGKGRKNRIERKGKSYHELF
jgi:hypothetical protein